MEHAVTRFNAKDLVVGGALALAVMASLPLLGILAFVLRPIVVVVAVAAFLAGCCMCAISSRFRTWLCAQSEPGIVYRGLRLAPDIAMHEGHGWARIGGATVVGADDLVQAALGPVDAVELPEKGTHVQQGEPLFRLRRGERTIAIPSPLTGTVIGGNEALRQHPELINQQPFGMGWAVRLDADAAPDERRFLLRGCEARQWFRREVDHVLELLPGGEADARQLHRRLDETKWSRVSAAMFSTHTPSA
jgi:glycine cleavage system H protein